MPHIADDQQVEAVALDEVHDARHGMAGDDMSAQLDILLPRLSLSAMDHLLETVAGRLSLLHDLFNAVGQARQLLDGYHVQLALQLLCQSDSSRQRLGRTG